PFSSHTATHFFFSHIQHLHPSFPLNIHIFPKPFHQILILTNITHNTHLNFSILTTKHNPPFFSSNQCFTNLPSFL
ncbi:hypothetical protein, partial [Bacillus sp. WP8]|uniref:hypothetical protein n=1 Tax=Bacillus sp. WP8 TaxID=756828 RepID=UPI001C930B76